MTSSVTERSSSSSISFLPAAMVPKDVVEPRHDDHAEARAEEHAAEGGGAEGMVADSAGTT